MQYCIYLRKSRADIEAEAHGEGETLARHEKTLLELAKKQKLNVTEIYREIVSGETIAARPVMQQLLQEVEQGIWNGVLVMEVERLARGDTIDQGIVAQTFKYSDTVIITPMKTYNPNNEFDEEYFEFGLFMSRREYKTINRRLQRGRIASVKEGKYVASEAPYGYKRVRIEGDKGWTLSPVADEAEIIRLIFELYTIGEKKPNGSYERLGTSLIARRLNIMKIPTRKGGPWALATIRDILINPVYIGKIRWNWRKNIKKMVDGQISVSRPRSDNNECIIVKGLHPALISEETFNTAQQFMSQNPPRPIGERNTVKNPLSGIVICGKCGRRMIRRPYSNNNPDTLMCPNPSCSNVSSKLNIVEERILDLLKMWLDGYKLQLNTNSNKTKQKTSQIAIKRKAIQKLQTELDILNNQLNHAHDLLEQNVYDIDTFLNRSRLLSQKIEQTKENIKALKSDLNDEIIREEASATIVPKIETLLKTYSKLPSPKMKNDVLKEVIDKVIYVKDKSARWHSSPDNFKITVHPKLPKQLEKK